MEVKVEGAGQSREKDIGWDHLDKTKFVVYGLGAFSGVTTLLYPMIVIKTRVQASRSEGSGGFKGALLVARSVVQNEGFLGLYRGYTTIIFGMIPGRMLYMTSLELAKSSINKVGRKLEVPETVLAGLSNSAAGAVASLTTQLVAVPIDVVSQRQMVSGAALTSQATSSAVHAAAATTTATTTASATTATAASASAPSAAAAAAHASSSPAAAAPTHAAAAVSRPSVSAPSVTSTMEGTIKPGERKQGLHTWATQRQSAALPSQQSRLIASSHASSSTASTSQQPIGSASGIVRQILKDEGVRGLYRGFGASVATFVPSSALWWGSYGLYQNLIWTTMGRIKHDAASEAARPASPTSTGEVVSVQVLSAILAGTTSSFLTNPLDLVKTRIQVARKRDGQATTFRAVWEEIIREEGYKGMFRGAVPRMANAALWGTCMVSTYEFLKRVSKKDPATMDS